MEKPSPLVGVIMGSKSDWETMKHSAETLSKLEVPHEVKIVSAHSTTDLLIEYARTARSRGLRAIIAGAGGSAHLPGMTAALTDSVPVKGVAIESEPLKGIDALYSMIRMPAGTPVSTMGIGKPGAINAALAAAEIISYTDERVLLLLRQHRKDMEHVVLQANEDHTWQ